MVSGGSDGASGDSVPPLAMGGPARLYGPSKAGKASHCWKEFSREQRKMYDHRGHKLMTNEMMGSLHARNLYVKLRSHIILVQLSAAPPYVKVLPSLRVKVCGERLRTLPFFIKKKKIYKK